VQPIAAADRAHLMRFDGHDIERVPIERKEFKLIGGSVRVNMHHHADISGLESGLVLHIIAKSCSGALLLMIA
jgi:hypothetical protein